MRNLPETGFLRLSQVLVLIPVSKSTWWAGVRSGRFPKPTSALGGRITCWRAEHIWELINRECEVRRG
ncbi:helix-turn-helix transcriptional regulator [Agrilutibacter solisilvae]|uniref:AlpA family phage regulatory protein n=1 Tax=Agrilutibacter solisilvae TaxID=2763317 RepID=A0A975ARQ5_9GAMM|nr:AlpA family phage regulatory protein [Lysobacter solisilvae]QSX77483.1 AlpA family phage regulatory protein [Lysobacter solisilvae]